MPRTEWHQETWDEAVNLIREHFTDLGFEVHVNSLAETVTVIHRATSQALTISNTTGGRAVS